MESVRAHEPCESLAIGPKGMCGICGRINIEQSNGVSEQDLRLMTHALRHRGPDDEGSFLDGNVGLAFRRLSIIDLHTGHQPLSNEDGTVWLVFNGEIYNFEELRRSLLQRGHVFRTKTDTECVVHLYEEHGQDCVQYLRGMFAFALWDVKKRQLLCARDRFGIKPLYYRCDQASFAFASEIKGILQTLNPRPAIDLDALDSYFAYGYVVGDRTIYQGIRKLRPGHLLTIHPSRPIEPHITRYWDVNFDPDYSRTEEQWCEELEQKLSESVRMHMISDVPLGAFLSGGIDSSSVVALMSQHATGPVKTFSIGFPESDFNELEYARLVAKQYNTDHHEQILEPESVNLISTLVKAYDEPYADSSAIPTYYVSKFAREFVTVALSGDGGDELFGGYTVYAKLQALQRWNLLPDAMNRLVWGAVHGVLPNKLKGKGISFMLSRQKRNIGAHITTFNQSERNLLYRWELLDSLGSGRAEAYKEALIASSHAREYLSKMQELDIRTYMVDDILTKVDIASMHHSLEVRVPLLDHEFAELAMRIPARYRLKTGQTKYILKQAMRRHLSPEVMQHRKQGFSVPLKTWFKADLREYVADRLANASGKISEYLNQDYITKIVADHNSGTRDFNNKIWTLLFFDAWLEEQNT